MDLMEAYLHGRKLLNQHGLGNWSLEFDNAKARYGCCWYMKRTITLSKILTPHQTFEQVNDTILHEIAHALVGPGHGHNKVWKQKAIEIGCNGKRCGDKSPIKGRYSLICDHCGHTSNRFKKPRQSYSCGKCSGGKYDPKYKLRLIVENKIYEKSY